MKLFMSSLATLAAISLTPVVSHAATVVEAVAPGKLTGNFSSLGHSLPNPAAPSSALGLTAPNSVFGNPNNATGPDQYTFRYTPGTDLDNTVFAAGTVLGNSSATDPDGAGPLAPVYATAPQLATGLTGGQSGMYNVYFTAPASINVSTTGSLFEITSDLGTVALNPVNLNSGGTGPDDPAGGTFTGGANNRWLRLATVHLTAGNSYTVRLTANSPVFVSQRAHAVMWEALSVDQPTAVPLPGIAAGSAVLLAGIAGRRRR